MFNDAMLKYFKYEKSNEVREKGRFALIKKVIVNQCIDYIRKKRIEFTDIDGLEFSDNGNSNEAEDKTLDDTSNPNLKPEQGGNGQTNQRSTKVEEITAGHTTSARVPAEEISSERAGKTLDANSNPNPKTELLANAVDSTQGQRVNDRGRIEEESTAARTGSASSEPTFGLVSPIAVLDAEFLSMNAATSPLPTIDIEDVQRATRGRRYYLSIAASTPHNTVRQYAFGFGKYFRLKNHLGLDVQLGGSLNSGYSFSQDSVTILNGLSIVEERRDKDLKQVGNAYLSLGAFYQKYNWRFGVGLRGSYALFNQFYFVENTQITHLGTFNTLSGMIVEREEQGGWTGMNRMGIDGYLQVNYHLNTHFSVGLMVEKRFNPLIQQDLAKRAHSNTPLELGVVMNKHF